MAASEIIRTMIIDENIVVFQRITIEPPNRAHISQLLLRLVPTETRESVNVCEAAC